MTQTSFGPNGFKGNGYLNMSPVGTSGNTGHIPRAISIGHNGSTSTQTKAFHVGNDFGMAPQGGHFFVGGHGWQSDRFYGMVDWNNGGGSGGITTVRWNPFMSSDYGLTVSLSHDSSYTITVTLTGTHTNGHGWQVWAWGPK